MKWYFLLCLSYFIFVSCIHTLDNDKNIAMANNKKYSHTLHVVLDPEKGNN